jgi:hypothetical protein
MFNWLVNCKAITRVVSEAMDRPLPLHRRAWMWMHLMMCRNCSEFRNQLQLLRDAGCHDAIDREIDAATTLSEAAKGRIRELIRSGCEPS